MDGLPDYRPGTFEMRDLLNLALTCVTAWLAVVGGELAKRQAEMDGKAHQVEEIRLGREAQVEVIQRRRMHDGSPESGVSALVVRNAGVADIQQFKWLLVVAADVPSAIICRDAGGDVVTATQPPLPGSDDVFTSGYRFSGTYVGTVAPGGSVEFARIELADGADAADGTFGWWIGTKHRAFTRAERDGERFSLRRAN